MRPWKGKGKHDSRKDTRFSSVLREIRFPPHPLALPPVQIISMKHAMWESGRNALLEGALEADK